MINIDFGWVRIDEEFNSDGDRVKPRFAKMARTEGGMIIGRVVRDGEVYVSEKWKAGLFVDVGQSSSLDSAIHALESAT
jgi:hypothetical protein